MKDDEVLSALGVNPAAGMTLAQLQEALPHIPGVSGSLTKLRRRGLVLAAKRRYVPSEGKRGLLATYWLTRHAPEDATKADFCHRKAKAVQEPLAQLQEPPEEASEPRLEQDLCGRLRALERYVDRIGTCHTRLQEDTAQLKNALEAQRQWMTALYNEVSARIERLGGEGESELAQERAAAFGYFRDVLGWADGADAVLSGKRDDLIETYRRSLT